MASPLPCRIPDFEPTPEQVARWQAELSRDMASADRTPVVVVEGDYTLPLVFTKDGAVFQLERRPVRDGDTEETWRAMPPIPGSPAALSGEFHPDNGRPRMYDCPKAAEPFLPEDGPVRRNGSRS